MSGEFELEWAAQPIALRERLEGALGESEPKTHRPLQSLENSEGLKVQPIVANSKHQQSRVRV